MNAAEFRRWLAKRGCKFENHKGGRGHLMVRLGGKTSQPPMRGSHTEPGTGLVNKIKKDLGLT
jgi:mRNA interferase HicA